MTPEEYDDKLEDMLRLDFPNWEADHKAYQFGHALWQATEAYIQTQYENKEDYDYLSKEELADKVFRELEGVGMLKYFLTDNLRKLIIKYHARNQSTTAAVLAILRDERYEKMTPFYLFKYANVCGFENIKKFLVARLSYLKPGNVHFPKKKYGDFWKEARQEYLENLKEIPLTSVEEQLQSLSEHYQDLETEFKDAQGTTDKERFHKCMMRTMAAIHLITRNTSLQVSDVPALTQEQRTQSLPTPDDTPIIEIPDRDVSLVSS